MTPTDRWLVKVPVGKDAWDTIRMIGDPSEGLTKEVAKERAARYPGSRIVPVNAYQVEREELGAETWIFGSPPRDGMRVIGIHEEER